MTSVQDHKNRFTKHKDKLLITLEPRFGLTQTLESLDVFSSNDSDTVRQEDTIACKNAKLLELLQEKSCEIDFIQFREALQKTSQDHVLNYLDSDGDVKLHGCLRPLLKDKWPLTKDDLSRISRNKLQLMEVMETTDLVEHLTAEKCINDWMRQRIRAEVNSYDRNELLLDILSRRSYADYRRFIYWLHNTCQSHVAKLLTDDGYLIEVHVHLNDVAAEDEVVSRWKEIGWKMFSGEILTDDEHFEMKTLLQELRRRKVEVVNCQPVQSIRVWLWCHAFQDVTNVQELIENGHLCELLVTLFKCLLQRNESLTAKLNVNSEQFKHAEECFNCDVTKMPVPKTSGVRNLLQKAWYRIRKTFAKEQRLSYATVPIDLYVQKTHEGLSRMDGDTNSMSTVLVDMVEVLELLLLKTAIIFTISLWKTKPNPDGDIFAALASVCSSWHRAMTSRKWFHIALKQSLSKFCSLYRRRAELLSTLDTEDCVVAGIAELYNNIYIICAHSNKILVYATQPTYHRLCDIVVKEFSSPWDIVAGNSTGHLYISDLGVLTIWQVKINNEVVLPDVHDDSSKEVEVKHDVVKWASYKWSNNVRSLGSLSISKNSDVIVTDADEGELSIFSQAGERLAIISLFDIPRPRHALQLTTNTYIVAHGEYPKQLNRVCEIDKVGLILNAFGSQHGSGPDQLSSPTRLALGKDGKQIFVVDDYRVLALSRSLKLLRVLLRRPPEIDHIVPELRRRRMCYVEETGRLLVAWQKGFVHVYNVHC